MLLIYVLLAIPFRSYSQPLLIMAVIPFGAVGAVIGHMLLGFSMSVNVGDGHCGAGRGGGERQPDSD